jgi:cell division protein ZapE
VTGESHPVASRLARDVAARVLDFDQAQADAAARLDLLAAALNRGAEPQRPWAGWLPASLRGRGARGESVRGVYLWGEVGRGKTHLMDLFYDSLRFEDRMRSHFYRFMQQVHAGLRTAAGRADPLEAVAAEFAREARLICLDEFFVSDIADAMILGGLLRALIERNVTLVATSNVAPTDLYRDGLQRERFLPAIGLLESRMEVVQLIGGTDYRLRRLRRAHVYFDSTQATGAAAMAELWGALAGDATAASAAAPADLVLLGRAIRAQRLATGMVWFEFADLCSGPRSQDDYIALARSQRTIFLSNVPRLGVEDENEARRFLMLVDELYDRRVQLVISAAAGPEDLYRGTRLRAEFARTVSRLHEMQSESYLAATHRP